MKYRLLIVLGLIIALTIPFYSMPHVDCLQTTYPDSRGGHVMVFDPYNNVVVMYGGMSVEGGLHTIDETWLYDYALNEWTELILNPSPSGRANYAMVYCNVTNEIILYGGGQATDTWSFDCETQTWSEVSTTTNPGGHHSHGMAYDPQQNSVILFGGFGADGWVGDDTWKFDCATRDWTELSPSTTPLARYGHVMTYDETVNRIIMTCGNTAYQGHQDDTWEFDVATSTWTEVTTTGNPDHLKWPSMTYDSVNDKSILFGGQVSDNPVDGTFIYDAQSQTWTEADPDLSPPPRINTGLAVDTRYGVTILFGGWHIDDGEMGDLWAYSYEDNEWTDMSGVSTTQTPVTTTSSSGTTTTPPPSEVPLEFVVIPIVAVVACVIVFIILKRR